MNYVAACNSMRMSAPIKQGPAAEQDRLPVVQATPPHEVELFNHHGAA